MCKIKDCKDKIYKDGLCATHWFDKQEQDIYLDNSDINNLGIVRWARDFLPEYACDLTPEMHKDLYNRVLQLYNPFYTNKFQRLLELINYRGSAKSTVVTMILPTYILVHNGMEMKIRDGNGELIIAKIKENFIVIVSETGGMAEDFVVRIRDEFSINNKLRFFYKGMFENAVDGEDGQWTRKAFKYNSCYVLGVGTGQQIRGRIKGASRPTLMLGDDLYSENNTVTEENRRKIRVWWNKAAFNSVDDVKGKCVVMGTIVHEDTILIDLERNKLWKTIKYTLMPIELFERFKAEHLNVDQQLGTCSLPFDDVENEYNRIESQRNYFNELQAKEDWKLAWKERADLYFIAMKYQEATINSTRSSFYQEYFHVVVSEDQKRFTENMFQKIENAHVEYKYGYNWITIPELYDEPQICTIDFGIDMASGQKEGDDTVIMVTAALKDNRRINIYRYIGKTSMRDVLYDDLGSSLRKDKVVIDRSLIKKIGVIDEAFRLALIFHPRYIKVGQGNAAEYTIIEEFRKVFRANYLYDSTVMARTQTSKSGKKEERIANTLLPFYETMSVYHLGDMKVLEHQLMILGHGAYDDAADACEVAFFNLTNPEDISITFFEQKKVEKKKSIYNRNTNIDKQFDWKVN